MHRRSIVAAALATLIGFVVLPVAVPARGPVTSARTYTPPLMFGLLLVLVLAVVFAEIADGGIDSKAIAMLGVLSAVNAGLRPLGAGTAGIETVFFMLVFAGRVFGPGFGFALGCTSLFASAIITGGVGPWMPYQMFGCAWVGLFAGLLPPCRGRREIAMLAAYGVFVGFFFGFMLNLQFWPFSVDPGSSISYLPGRVVHRPVAPLPGVRRHHLARLGHRPRDHRRGLHLPARAGALPTLRRAARRANFNPAVTFAPHRDEPTAHRA